MTQNKLRISYNVPKAMIPEIQLLCAQKGIEPAYWLRKAIEKALSEETKTGEKSNYQ